MAENHTRKNYSNVEAVDILHQVANLYISTKIPQDYGTGEEYTSVEVHTLKHIADNPGITVTELARDYAKTCLLYTSCGCWWWVRSRSDARNRPHSSGRQGLRGRWRLR